MEINTVTSFLDYYGRVRQRTLNVVDAIPADRIDWQYAPGKFTFADMLRHLGAIERYMWAETVMHHPSSYPGHGKRLADGYDAVINFFSLMHEESMEIFAGLSDSDLQGRCLTPAGASIATWKWLRALVEHEIHHRGQLYVYLGILNISAPPVFGMVSEEVRSLSVPTASE